MLFRSHKHGQHVLHPQGDRLRQRDLSVKVVGAGVLLGLRGFGVALFFHFLLPPSIVRRRWLRQAPGGTQRCHYTKERVGKPCTFPLIFSPYFGAFALSLRTPPSLFMQDKRHVFAFSHYQPRASNTVRPLFCAGA